MTAAGDLTGRLGERVPLAQPLLVFGPRGCGKRRAARELGQRLSSASEPLVDLSGRTLVMDPAAPTDERDARYSVRRVLHDLSLAATGPRCVLIELAFCGPDPQNALLKTLEEPPALTSLILVTDDPAAVLPTVRSRCVRVPLPALTDDDLAAHASTAGIDVTEAQIRLAAGDLELLRFLAGYPGLAEEIARGDAPCVAARIHSIDEDKDAGVTKAQARRQFALDVVRCLTRTAPSVAAAERVERARLDLQAGLKAEPCLSRALLAASP